MWEAGWLAAGRKEGRKKGTEEGRREERVWRWMGFYIPLLVFFEETFTSKPNIALLWHEVMCCAFLSSFRFSDVVYVWLLVYLPARKDEFET